MYSAVHIYSNLPVAVKVRFSIMVHHGTMVSTSHHDGAGDTEEEGEELGRAARPQRAQGVQASPPAAG